MHYFPVLTFLSGIFWASKFGGERLIFAGAAALHAVLALLVLLVALALAPRVVVHGSRLRLVGWHAFWALILSLWNLAATSNYLSRQLWGDPMSFDAMLGLSRQDAVQDQLAVLRSPSGLLILLGSLLLVYLGYLAYVRVAAALRDFGRPVLSYHRGLLVVCLAFVLVAAFRYPGISKEEPIFAFAGKAGNFSDLQGLEERRAAARLADRKSLLNYTANGQQPTKNVVLILADSLRADRLQAYGYARPTTPFLRRLLEDPRTQKAEYAFSSCSESFCGITSTLTGRPYPEVSHGSAKIYDYLGQVGYTSELILSGDHVHLADLPLFYGDGAKRNHSPEVDRLLMESDDRGILEYLEQLPDFDGRPRFFFFFVMSSHAGGRRLPQFNQFRPDDSNLARARWNNNDAAEMLRSIRRPPTYLEGVANYYDNGVQQADFFIEKIFTHLEKRGYLDDGLVIVSSDHADTLGEHNHIGHTHRLYNTDIRIPLLLWDSDPSARPKELPIAAQPNIAPTILSRLGLPVPAALTASPLDLPQEHFESQHVTRRQQEPCAAAISGNRQRLYKLIACTDHRSPVREELYEMIADPGEQNDLLQDPVRQAEAAALLPGLRARLDFFYQDMLGAPDPASETGTARRLESGRDTSGS